MTKAIIIISLLLFGAALGILLPVWNENKALDLEIDALEAELVKNEKIRILQTGELELCNWKNKVWLIYHGESGWKEILDLIDYYNLNPAE